MLPAAIERIRRKLASTDDGNRQTLDIVTAVLTDGLPAEAACAEALSHSVHSADVLDSRRINGKSLNIIGCEPLECARRNNKHVGVWIAVENLQNPYRKGRPSP
ncbi:MULTISPECIES: hypothetical protein [unclassified Bradyrhizobium]|uniref:hypothetical protein n=1 Tax=unclassified Bradyrhizobium TaxID=2631580 RepID=UPI00200025DC|nr:MULTISPECIES: hypothetical protein [unclassified Bradyrhizobium]